jgi:Domain of unknown function (DUF4253)
MEFPYEVTKVPGNQALDALAQLQKRTDVYPVILGDSDTFNRVAEAFEMNDGSPVDALLEAASKIEPLKWLANRQASDPDYYEICEGEWPEGEDYPNTSLSAHCNIRTRKPFDEVFIALVPTDSSWKVPAYLRIGGWNECPSGEEHAAIFKYWHEKYGASVACIADDVIEFQVERPPETREQALQLAKEQYVYCADIVHQGTESIEALASTLVKAPVWYFWWD